MEQLLLYKGSLFLVVLQILVHRLLLEFEHVDEVGHGKLDVAQLHLSILHVGQIHELHLAEKEQVVPVDHSH